MQIVLSASHMLRHASAAEVGLSAGYAVQGGVVGQGGFADATNQYALDRQTSHIGASQDQGYRVGSNCNVMAVAVCVMTVTPHPSALG